MAEIRDQARPDGVRAGNENNRNGAAGLLGGGRGRATTCRYEHVHPARNQFRRHRGKAVVATVRPAILYGHIIAFHETGFL